LLTWRQQRRLTPHTKDTCKRKARLLAAVQQVLRSLPASESTQVAGAQQKALLAARTEQLHIAAGEAEWPRRQALDRWWKSACSEAVKTLEPERLHKESGSTGNDSKPETASVLGATARIQTLPDAGAPARLPMHLTISISLFRFICQSLAVIPAC
jgi:hypothetical protein